MSARIGVLFVLCAACAACVPSQTVIPQARIAGAAAELTATAEYTSIMQTATAENYQASIARLQIAQTEVAIISTLQALAIDSDSATQSAQETAQASGPEATRQVAGARSAEAGRRSAEWAGWIISAGLVGLFVAAFAALILIAGAQRQRILAEADERRAGSITSQRFHAPGVVGWYEPAERRWFFDAAPLPALPQPTNDPVSDHALQEQWRVACHIFLQSGERWGFGVRDIAADDRPQQKVISVDGWRMMTETLERAGILTRSGGKNRKTTTWADGWGWERWESGGWKALPHFSIPAPDISLARHSVTASQRHNSDTAANG